MHYNVFSTFFILGRSCGSRLVQCSTNVLIHGYWIPQICSSLIKETVDGRRRVDISSSKIPKLYTSIAGEWRLGKRASGAENTALPGAVVRFSHFVTIGI